jgi:hypothetical protein
MECAIAGHKLRCVRILTDFIMEKQKDHPSPSSSPPFNSSHTFSPLTHLQYACREGASECLQYFVERFPDSINAYGPDGDTPLLTAVPWGEECVKVCSFYYSDIFVCFDILFWWGGQCRVEFE